MRFLRFVALALALGFAGSAQALSVTGGGIDQALGCSSVLCGSTQTLTLDPGGGPVASVAGTIELDATAMELSFQLSVVELALAPVAGSDDNGVSQVVFSNTSYAASGLSLFAMGGGSYLIGPAQTAAVEGMQTQMGVAGPAAFAAPTARVNGSCLDLGVGLSCGLSFGQSSFVFDVGASPEARYFQHTANFVASGTVPEPSTAALVGLGLLAAAAGSRRR